MDSTSNGDFSLELFEGMELMAPSDFMNKPSDDEIHGHGTVNSSPLDENLFSDLNICTINEEDQSESTHKISSIDETPRSIFPIQQNNPTLKISAIDSNAIKNPQNRQSGLRRKKRSFKIGYARDDNNSDDVLVNNNVVSNSNSIPPTEIQDDLATKKSDVYDLSYVSKTKELEIRDVGSSSDGFNVKILDVQDAGLEDSDVLDGGSENLDTRDIDISNKISDGTQIMTEEMPVLDNEMLDQVDLDDQDHEKVSEDVGVVEPSFDSRLEDIKQKMKAKLKELQEKGAAISASRKSAARRRREAAEEVGRVSRRYSEIEKELEVACEMEDFEKAEMLSESLASAEKAKQDAVVAFKEAENECDKLALSMQEVLEMQISVEEDGVRMLQCLHKEAVDFADATLQESEKYVSSELETWQAEKEMLELKKMEADLELKVIEDVNLSFKQSIEESVREDIEAKQILTNKRETLMHELENLLALVRAKEEEISENDTHIQTVEKWISDKMLKFDEKNGTIKTKYEELHLLLKEIENSNHILSTKKIEIDQSEALAEHQRLDLLELADDASKEANTLNDLVSMRKSIISSFLQSRESKVKLAEKEEDISKDIQGLRQKVTDARSSLQELQSLKVTSQQSVISMKQRISYIERRCPELEAEKKVAAAARNFKEAGRVASEAKALSAEKDNILSDMEKTLSDLQKVEDEIKEKVTALQENESLINLKEREAAMARCERLRLVAASAREEQAVALEADDAFEAENLLAEAEAADLEADQLQEACNFDGQQFIRRENKSISVALAGTLTGMELEGKSNLVPASAR